MDLNQLDRTIDSLALATSNYVQVNDVNEVTVKMTEALARLVIARASIRNEVEESIRDPLSKKS